MSILVDQQPRSSEHNDLNSFFGFDVWEVHGSPKAERRQERIFLHDDDEGEEHLMKITADYEFARDTMMVEYALTMDIPLQNSAKMRTLDLLRTYNGLKDSSQHLIGSLACLMRVTTGDIHQKFSLS